MAQTCLPACRTSSSRHRFVAEDRFTIQVSPTLKGSTAFASRSGTAVLPTGSTATICVPPTARTRAFPAATAYNKVTLSSSSRVFVYHESEVRIMAKGNHAQGKDKKKAKAAPKKDAKAAPKKAPPPKKA
jgi:hypothetical protein